MSPPRAAVIVLTKDGGEHLFRGLDAVAAARAPSGGLEIVLVDNGSHDGAPEKAKARYPGIRLVSLGRNAGFARGVHEGVASTQAPVVVLVNDDAEVEHDALAALVEALSDAPPDAVAAAGLLLDATGERVDFAEGLVTFDGHAFSRGAGRRVADVEIGRRGDPRLFPCGGFCALRRRDFLELGGFDGDYFAYLEDVDFGWRASLAGRTTLFVPEARARHLAGATGRRLGNERRGTLIESNAFATVYKNLGDESLRGLLAPILATFQNRVLRALLGSGSEVEAALADEFAPERSPGLAVGTASPLNGSRLARSLARLSGIRPPRAVREDAGPGHPFRVDGANARMWLTAWRRMVDAWPVLAARRAGIQARRRVGDDEVFARYPLHLVPTYDGDEELFASEHFRSLLPERPRLVPRALSEIGGG